MSFTEVEGYYNRLIDMGPRGVLLAHQAAINTAKTDFVDFLLEKQCKSGERISVGVFQLVLNEYYYHLRFTVRKTVLSTGLVNISAAVHMRDCKIDSDECDCVAAYIKETEAGTRK